MPIRLLRIFPSSNGSSGDVVRFVDPKSLEEVAGLKYSTLSYCWDGKPDLELTTGTMSSVTNGIETCQLSRTIEDAIWVTKILGMEFIWVDSLCIIQDSPEDWAREALRMSDVYRNCFFSIAARAASSAKDGLFCKRDPLLFENCFLADPGNAYAAVASFSLQKRKKRVIFFPQNVLYPPLVDPEAAHMGVLYVIWLGIVEGSSAAALSVKTDRLYALTGIFAAFQVQTDWGYGLWGHQLLLHHGLLWSIKEFGGNPTTDKAWTYMVVSDGGHWN